MPDSGKQEGPTALDQKILDEIVDRIRSVCEPDRVILFVGALCEVYASGGCDWEPTSETWAYDLDTNTWTNMEPPEAPHGPLTV